jgi:hypothetical protein
MPQRCYYHMATTFSAPCLPCAFRSETVGRVSPEVQILRAETCLPKSTAVGFDPPAIPLQFRDDMAGKDEEVMRSQKHLQP